MVKAKEFWNCLCDEFDYRFFSGVPCIGLKSLYDNMSSEFMHYIPAAREDIALGLVSGAFFGGANCGILVNIDSIMDLYRHINNFNFKYNIPFLMVIYNDSNKTIPFKLSKVKLTDNFKRDLKKVVNNINRTGKPCALIINEGVLL
jgi:hypothetical protein